MAQESGTRRCNTCGALLAVDGSCPACRIGLGLSPSTGDETQALPQAAKPRERIGPYTILDVLGEGGMGIVYLAEQRQPIRRRVALKLIKPGMDSGQVVARFESERQALALMNHPNVAKVLEAGISEDGRPYFVMEYIEGLPITAYCDRHRLSIRERLELFSQACGALQHAHQTGIIHRDVKPSNVMVAVLGGRPTVKVIDFGVARATSQRLTERTLYTQEGTFIGTPEYMSPEQAELSGREIDARSDVYSLGVLLYELLVGALPFELRELREAGFDEMRRKIREDDPPKPSTRLLTMGDRATDSAGRRSMDAAALRRTLEGDLDWIAMRALEKDRARRYASADAMALDIARMLRDEPVSARPPSTAYRVMKFLRRRRMVVVPAFLVFATTFVGVMATLWQARIGLREFALASGASKEQRDTLLLPQFLLYSYLTLAGLAGVAYFSRATVRRLLGALAGGGAFAVVFVLQARFASSSGLWRYALADMPEVPRLVFAVTLVGYGSILGLIGWRVIRRFGWRGQAAFIAVMGIVGPARDALGASLTSLIVITPGALPALMWAVLWALNVTQMLAVMRLVAGPAGIDRLARASVAAA